MTSLYFVSYIIFVIIIIVIIVIIISSSSASSANGRVIFKKITKFCSIYAFISG